MRSSPATRSTRACWVRSAPRASSTASRCGKVPLRASSPRRSARRRGWSPARTWAGSAASSPRSSSPSVDVPVLLDGAQGVGAVAGRCRSARLRRLRGRRAEVDVRSRRHRHAVRQRRSCASAWRSRGAATATWPSRTPGSRRTPHEDGAALRRAVAERRGRRLRARRRRGARGRRAGPAVHERARTLAARLAELLRERRPRGRAARARPRWSPSPAPIREERAALAEQGVVVRNIPDRPWLRASVGAWNDEQDLERLVGTLDARA